jgi:hypothetical protein
VFIDMAKTRIMEIPTCGKSASQKLVLLSKYICTFEFILVLGKYHGTRYQLVLYVDTFQTHTYE